MAKFYVESGTFQGIIDTMDSEMAAVWVVHRMMLPAIPESLLGDELDDSDVGLFRLDDEISIHERGFGRPDAERIPTPHAFARWAQLMSALESMSDDLDAHK